MTVFTSYFANIGRILSSGYENIDLVNISLYPPNWFTKGMPGIRSCKLFAPSEELFTEYQQRKNTSNPMRWNVYAGRFYNETIWPLKQRGMIRTLYYDLLMGSKDVFLLCWEPPYEHCHRRLVAEALEQAVPGIHIDEWRYRE